MAAGVITLGDLAHSVAMALPLYEIRHSEESGGWEPARRATGG